MPLMPSMHRVLAALLFFLTILSPVRAAAIPLSSSSAICYAAILEAREALAEEQDTHPISQNVVAAIVLGILLLVASITALCLIGSSSFRHHLCCVRGSAGEDLPAKPIDVDHTAYSVTTLGSCDGALVAHSSFTGTTFLHPAQVVVPAPSVALPIAMDR
ncbi:uncharacterized protein SCHCODRAFT_02568505 [Schizophyllum commune H4-8]|nr:uncharacterized protein SCHCODRAFT_02568505 [Schizophyllum commune H4-8]KAI5896243.1 hypothetical protein SCHCODRAFT_02568505 [Schizophyllum commune H4-8]